MKNFILRQLSEIGRIENGVFQMQLLPALITYLLMSFGLVFYILPRMKRQSTFLNAFFCEAPMGHICLWAGHGYNGRANKVIRARAS